MRYDVGGKVHVRNSEKFGCVQALIAVVPLVLLLVAISYTFATPQNENTEQVRKDEGVHRVCWEGVV